MQNEMGSEKNVVLVPAAINKHIWGSLNSDSSMFECQICGLGAVRAGYGLLAESFDFCQITYIKYEHGYFYNYKYVDRYYSCNEWLMIKANE